MQTARTRKKDRVLLWEILIIAAVLIVLIATQLLGTSSVAGQRGDIRIPEDLNGRKFGAMEGSDQEETIRERWPDSEIVYAEETRELPEMALDDEIDAFLIGSDQASELLGAYPELTAMVDSKRSAKLPEDKGTVSSQEVVDCIIIRAADSGYVAPGKTLSDLEKPGTRIAGLTGSELADFPGRIFPESEITNYNSFSDIFMALENDKVDAATAYFTQLSIVDENYDDLAFIGTPLVTVHSGFGTSKTPEGDKLLKELDDYIARIIQSGELKQLKQKWERMTEEEDSHLESSFSGENGELRVCTTGSWFPMSYFAGSELTGEFIEIVKNFCTEKGYIPVFECCDYAAEVAGLNTGSYDIMADTLYITEERLEQINITRPILSSDLYMVVKNPGATQEVSRFSTFLERLQNGFYNNFIKDERWKMLLSGLGTTLLMALAAGILGTLLGGLICRMRMSRSAPAAAFARLYVRLIQGIPVLVLLMVLYYVIFNHSGVSALRICILGFSLDFAAYASEIFRSGIEAVPAGQARAAKALGFTQVRGFVKVILPQAMRHILPVYSGQLISMVKLTSVAGYISVLELTKVSDIIRSRTFDAFYPLITTALIYFLLSYLLIGLMKTASRRMMNRTPARALKGIDPAHAELPDELREDARQEASGKELLVIEHLSKSFEDVTPLKDVSCMVCAGDVISVIGPSGTGKSTFLNLINRLEIPDSGTILYDGEDTGTAKYPLNHLRQRIGMVFQSFNLFPHLTIVENVMLAQTELLNRSRQEAYDRAMALLNTVGLSGKAMQYPAELSGGQQQRAAIARTLAMDPEIILFDEPTSALDPTMVGEVLTVIRNLAQRGITMIIVTHEMKFARDVSSRIFYMDEGLIYEEGTPEKIFDFPEKDRTRQFIRHLKVFRCSIGEGQADFMEMLTGIDEFSRKQMIPGELNRGMLVVAEELCIHTLYFGGADHGRIELTCEYSPENGGIGFTVEYGGIEGNPLDDKTIPIQILKNAVPEMTYCRENGKNRFTGRIVARHTL